MRMVDGKSVSKPLNSAQCLLLLAILGSYALLVEGDGHLVKQGHQLRTGNSIMTAKSTDVAAADGSYLQFASISPEELARRPFGSFPDYNRTDDSKMIYREAPALPSYLRDLESGLSHKFCEGGKACTEGDTRRRSLVQRQVNISYQSCNTWVAKDGSAAFRRIQDAVNKIPNPNRRRYTICIKNGIYSEQVTIPIGKDYVRLIGSGYKTIITAGSSQSKVGNPYFCATLVIQGKGFVAMALVVRNSVFSVWDPAPAVAVLATQSKWFVCALQGWIDTLALWTGAHYFESCYVEGKTDFIWGFGRGYFIDSMIYDKWVFGYTGYLTASGQDPQGGLLPGGLVFVRCRLTGTGSAYLGRPYRPATLVVMIYCYEGRNIVPAGWSDWLNRYKGGRVTFREINCYGPGFRPALRKLGRVDSHVAQAPPAYTLNNFLNISHWQ